MKVVAFDTETRGLDWFKPDHRAFLATWADEHGEHCADLSDPAQAARFTAALDEADAIVAHNLSFDVHMVRETLGYDVIGDGKVLHDTEIMSRVLYPEGQNKGQRGGHGLKNLAELFLSADAGDAEKDIAAMAKKLGHRTLKADGVYYQVFEAYPDIMIRYALLDARYTFDLYEKFRPSVQDLAIYELEMDVAPVLIRAEQRGIVVDQEMVNWLIVKYLREEQKLREHLTEVLGEGVIDDDGECSDADLAEALLKHGVPLTKVTKSGQISTDKWTLQTHAQDFPVVETLLEWRRVMKFLATYLYPAADGDGVIHPSFRQAEAWTGRMSCTKPNMQNWPKRAGKEVRSILVPREGHAFVVCDYDSIEVRLLAYYLHDPGFQKLIEEGHDAHAWMASNIWGGYMQDYVKGSDGEHLRSLAKNILFAITYGAGAPRVQAMLKDAGLVASRDHAKKIISQIKGSLPGYFKLNKRVREKVEAEGHVNTIMGRRNPVGKDKAYVGLNALIQGSAADIMKQGLVLVAEAVEPLGGIPLLVVHDEVLVEVPAEHASECLLRTEAALINAYPLKPGLAVSGSVVTTHYGDA